jgi:hypothetical protein
VSVRPIKSLLVPSLAELADAITRTKGYIALLLACDATLLSESEIAISLQPLVENRLVYLCAWGPDCSRLHDVADSDFARLEQVSSAMGWSLITTWHEDETLEEATWFFQNVAIPREEPARENYDRYAVSIGNAHWLEQIQDSLLKELPTND